MRRFLWTATALVLVAAACTDDGSGSAATPVGSVEVGTPAPTLAPDLDWVNASGAVDTVGSVTLVHFWRQSCLSCLEGLAEIEALQAEFGLTVIGVHSPKFPRETSFDVVRAAVQRLDYPELTVNDPARAIWNEWGISAWPTVAVIDADGNLAGGHVGLGAAEALRPMLADLVAANPDANAIPTGLPDPAPTVLSYPEAILADTASNRLFIADTGHHRIVIATLDTHEVLEVIGDGTAGGRDGPATSASFSSPRGLARRGSTLYVADTNNHLVRAVDLSSSTVTTLAGNGERETLNTPWDLVLDGDRLIVSLAGGNQLALVDTETGAIDGFTGASLAAPTGLAVAGDGTVYVADSESSSVKQVTAGGTVEHLAGGEKSLFDFGDVDGIGADARLQRPLGVAVGGGSVWVADTYNSKIKHIDLATGVVATVAGGEGWRDGSMPLFSAPTGLDLADGVLYVADRDNHSVRTVEIRSGNTETLILEGIERLIPTDAEFDGTLVTLDPVEVAAGAGTLTLDVTFPPGYKANELAPSRFEWSGTGDVVANPDAANLSLAGPAFPMRFDFTFAAGAGLLQGDIWLVYCESTAESICLFDRARVQVPLLVTASGSSDLAVSYEVTLPNGL